MWWFSLALASPVLFDLEGAPLDAQLQRPSVTAITTKPALSTHHPARRAAAIERRMSALHARLYASDDLDARYPVFEQRVQRMTARAEAAWRRALERSHEGAAELHIRLAMLLLDQGRSGEATIELRESLEEAPQGALVALASSLLGEQAWLDGDLQGAIEHYHLAADDPVQGHYALPRGVVLVYPWLLRGGSRADGGARECGGSAAVRGSAQGYRAVLESSPR